MEGLIEEPRGDDERILLAPGEYLAPIVDVGEIRMGSSGRIWYIQIVFDYQGFRLVNYIAGYPAGLMLIRKLKESLIGTVWKIGVKHREHDGRMFYYLSMVEPWQTQDSMESAEHKRGKNGKRKR